MTTTIGQYKGTDINQGTDAEISAQMKAIDANSVTPVSSLGGGTIVPASVPTQTYNTQQTTDATTSAVNAAQTPPVDPFAKVEEMVSKRAPEANVMDIYNQLKSDNSYADSQKEVNDLKAQLGSITSSTQTAQLGLEGQDVRRSAPILDKMQNQIARDNAIKALPISAALNAAQGRLDTAKENINTMLGIITKDQENKYKFQTDQINYALQFATGKKADMLLKQQNELDAQKVKDANFNTLKNAYIEAAINNKDFKTAGTLASATDVNSLTSLSKGMTALSSNDIVTLKDGTTLLIDKLTGKTIKTFGGGTGSASIPSSIVQTIQTDKGATPIQGYALKAGDDPYTIALQNGIDMATLSKLNPQVTDWHNLPVGAVLNLPNQSEKWLQGKTPAQVNAYNTLPDDVKGSVRQLVNGDALLTDIVKSRGANTQAQINTLINQVTAIDPSWSINTEKQRYAFKQSKWNNGKLFDNRTAINTALGHMATLAESSSDLQNAKFPKWNEIANWTNKNAGNPNLVAFQYNLTVLASEIASAYKGGTAPTDQETEKIYEAISSSYSPAQFKTVLTTSSKLMASKLETMSQEYKQVMGQYPEEAIIQPDILKQLKTAGIDTESIDKVLTSQGYSVPKVDAYNGINLGGGTYQGIKLPF